MQYKYQTESEIGHIYFYKPNQIISASIIYYHFLFIHVLFDKKIFQPNYGKARAETSVL